MTRARTFHLPPMDGRELHMPGYNYCGPGTNYYKRKKMRIQPMNALDAAAMEHDRWTESRGPQLAKTRKQVDYADRQLLNSARRIQARTAANSRYWLECQAVITAMQYRLSTPGDEAPSLRF